MHYKQLFVALLVLVGLGEALSCSSSDAPKLTEPTDASTQTNDAAAGPAATDAQPHVSVSAIHSGQSPSGSASAPNAVTTASASSSSLDAGNPGQLNQPHTDSGLPNIEVPDSSVADAAGEVISGEDSQIVIPPGAVNGSVEITIQPGTEIADEDEWTFHAAGAPIQFGPSGTTFSVPVNITLAYSPELVGDRPDLMVVAHRDDVTHVVTFIHPDSINDSDLNLSASSFSTFQPVMYTELMTGIVRDRNTNDPVVGARVFFHGTGYGTAVTDANGMYSFTVENLSSFGGALSGILYIGADGYFETAPITITDLGAQPSLPVINDVTLLTSPPLITGVITDATNSAPLADVTVSFNREPMSMFRGGATTVSVNTAADGSYAIDASFFRENQAHEFSAGLMINAPGFLGVTLSVDVQTNPVTQDFALNSSAGDLMTGVVRDRNTSDPIVGATVYFYGSGHGTATTNANGEYTFTAADLSSFGGALSGTLYVGADAYFQAPSIVVTDLSAQATLPVVNDVTLLASPPLITGVITDATNSAPLAGVTVSFNRNPMSTFRGGATAVSVTSAIDGSYAIDASFFEENDDGEFDAGLMINTSGFLGVTRQVNVHTNPVIEDFALNSSAGDLMTGVVRDRNSSAPIEGAIVFFYGSGYGSATTDTNGEYAFTVAQLSSFGGALSGTLYVGADGYFQAPAISVTDLAAQASLPVVNDVTLLASPPLITGIVTDSSNSDPLAGVTVSFTRNPMSMFRGGATSVAVITELDGSYAIDASFFTENPAGDFSANLMANLSGYLGASRATSFNPGPAVENLQLTPGTGP